MTDTLFDIPTNPKPSVLRNRAKAKLFADEKRRLKKLWHIWTHHADFMSREDHPWSALLFDKELREEYKEPEEAIAHYCRILDEQGRLVTGETERQAIKLLCEKNEIPNDL